MKRSISYLSLFTLFCVSLTTALLSQTAQTALALPPRPEPDPGPTPKPISGGGIELLVQSGQAESLKTAQTVVQWQDGLGDWHDVEGWRGTLDEIDDNWGKKMWWVSEKDFDTGPFRWLVYNSTEDKPLAASDSFYMPHSVGEVVRVEVSLVAQP